MTSTTRPLGGKTAIVTGASRGLGREMALELAQAGANLVLLGRTDGAALQDARAQVAQLGAETLALACDVADPVQCQAAVTAAIDRFGAIDVLINNAGIGMRAISETFNTVPTRFWDATPEAWAAIIAANVNGPFNMARFATPQMLAQGAGKIINISTSDQTMVRRGYAPYGPSKAALEAASRVWAQDLDGTGVTVNVYLPGGAADTDLLPPSAQKKGADGNLLSAAIMRRAIVWLCGAGSDGVTGARFIARHWNPDLPDAEAAAAARCRHVDKPEIM
ncbi:SDR family oxidoreductase [Pseudooceanicola sediminis]|uniref:SDR family oxidoreductase n=1 Tax=Pseudooceanicola sediminis TaxID=2211117 RepID=A0A399IXJ1_9RHOB|nr:SDR family oxidoreductase [Pseudooceanicola sediminis]RII37883.1 SDR family oxidoreductase [Pseudooceanicola sediminis]|tara:strand:- start:39123 stop:39956 length:834 start_codon:yes stop_codon:yes gene_type:complete